MPSTKSKTKPSPEPNLIRFDALGTQWYIELFEQSLTRTIRAQLFERIELFDKTYSRFRDDSFVTQLAQTAGVYALPSDMLPLLDLYVHLYELTDSKVTPLQSPVMQADAR